MEDNVIRFQPRPRDPFEIRMEAINKIVRWSVEMYDKGHMPEDVLWAFNYYFDDADQRLCDAGPESGDHPAA